jgi:hypothetical protein
MKTKKKQFSEEFLKDLDKIIFPNGKIKNNFVKLKEKGIEIYEGKYFREIHLSNFIIKDMNVSLGKSSKENTIGVAGTDYIIFNNCDISGEFTVHSGEKLTFNNCHINTLNSDRVAILEIIDSTINKFRYRLIVTGLTLFISNTEIDNFLLNQYRPSDKNGKKGELFTFGNLYFDNNSNIVNNNQFQYSFLRRISKQLGDKIQEHIFYIKELEAFRKGNSIDSDSKKLLFITNFVNKNGLSFIRPIVILLFLNSLIVVSIFLVDLS